jgi:hypothetical protein
MEWNNLELLYFMDILINHAALPVNQKKRGDATGWHPIVRFFPCGGCRGRFPNGPDCGQNVAIQAFMLTCCKK